jgi:hypothetical protein
VGYLKGKQSGSFSVNIWRDIEMPNVHVIHFLCYTISLNTELYNKFEKHRGDRSYAEAMRDLVCPRLSVQPGIAESVWCHTHEINAQINQALQKEACKRMLSKSETLRQLVCEQLEEDERLSLTTSTGYLKHRATGYLKHYVEIPVDKELSDKFEKYSDNRSHAQTMRNILCAALGIQLSKIDLSWGHTQKVDARIEKALRKETVKRKVSKSETVRQLVREQLESMDRT